MEIIVLGRNEIIMELPVFTKVGEEFDLEGPQFSPNTVGKVVGVLAQSGGRTRVKLFLLSGKAYVYAQNSDQQELNKKGQNQVEELVEVTTPRERFVQGSERIVQQGGTAWFTDRDPRPRSGVDSSVVANSSVPQQVEQHSSQQIEQSPALTTGVKINVKSSGQTINTANAQQPDFEPRIFQPPISRPVSKTQKISQEEYAKSLGRGVEQQIGKRGGQRKSHYQNAWVRDSEGNLKKI